MSADAVSSYWFVDPPSTFVAMTGSSGFSRIHLQSAFCNARMPLSWTSFCSRVLSRAGPLTSLSATLPTHAGSSLRVRSTTLMEFFSPTAHETWVATNTGFASPSCAAPSAFLRPLTLCSTLEPSVFRRPAPSCRPCFMPTTLLGFPLQRFPLPVARSVFRPRFPSRPFRTATVCANADCLDSHPSIRRLMSSTALRGLGTTGNPFCRPGAISHLAGADPLLGFQLFRVLSPAALALPSELLLPCPSSSHTPRRS
jgi:hypothetical protein